MNLASIGKNIRRYRKEQGYTIEGFAEKVGLSTNYVGALERGEKTPSLETFIDIVNALDVSSDQILADALVTGYAVQSSILSEKLKNISCEERARIYAVVDTMVNMINK